MLLKCFFANGDNTQATISSVENGVVGQNGEFSPNPLTRKYSGDYNCSLNGKTHKLRINVFPSEAET